MSTLFIVGGGLFGSLAAAYARSKGIEAIVFDSARREPLRPRPPGCSRNAGPDASCTRITACASSAGSTLSHPPILLTHDRRDAGATESLLFVPPVGHPGAEPQSASEVTSVGDGWLEAAGQRYEGWVYLAAGVWSGQFLPSLGVFGKAGAAFVFPGEHEGRMRQAAPEAGSASPSSATAGPLISATERPSVCIPRNTIDKP